MTAFLTRSAVACAVARAVVLAGMIGCWRSAPPPTTPPPEEPKTSPVAPAPRPPPTYSELVMEAFEEFAGRMCACQDASCVQAVSDDMMRWSQDMASDEMEPPKLSDEETQRAADIGERIGQCMQKAMTGAMGGASGTPTP